MPGHKLGHCRISLCVCTVRGQGCSTPYDILSTEATLSIAKQAVDAAGLQDTLDDPELDATIFIPNNAAFTLFLEQADGTAEDLLAFPGLADILKYHVHIVAHNISDINEGDNLDTLQGDEIFVQFKKDNDPKYAGCGGAHLHLSTFGSSPSDPLTCDIQACKSVIHIVDYPMLPNDEAIEEAFPNIEIRSSNSVEEGDDHDHDHDDDDHNDAAGASSAASYLKHTVVAVVMAAAFIF
ncbi:hypothetical protein NADE_006397 [Nannochloris sp. 'desiccata']|nr:hypothetical protein NADE_006397 [Chlorella desiccata (nom. nud.)]